MASGSDFYIKEGDTSPAIMAQLCDSAGDPVDLTNADVQFVMKPVGEETTTVDATASVTDPSNGHVEYSWVLSDTETAGYFNAVFRVDYNSTGTVDETFPNSQYISVRVDDSL